MRYLDQWTFFETVASEPSIRQAAEKLHITATALNRRILALEDEIGCPLFERLPSGVRLNPAGELLLQHVRGSRVELSRVLSQISDLSGLRRGHVQIACSAELASGFLPTEVALYRQQFPQVTFDISTEAHHLDVRLESLAIDLAISFDHLMPNRCQLIAHCTQPVGLVVHEDHPLAAKTTVRLHEITAYPIILPPEDSAIATLFALGLEKKQLKARKILHTDDPLFAQEYLHFEDSIRLSLPISLRADTPFIPLDQRDIGTSRLSIYKAKGRTLPVAVAKFIDQYLSNLGRKFPDSLE